MQLTQHTDFGLRTLIYLSLHTDRVVSVREVADAYGISKHHLTKVARALSKHGYVETVRGHTGGMRLTRPPAQIVVGEVVRQLEPGFGLVACFAQHPGSCVIAPACGLNGPLNKALEEFLKVLDGYTLADCVPNPEAMRRVFAPGSP